MGQYLSTERHDRVLLVRLSNPPTALMTAGMTAELDALVHDVDEDPGIGAVVLTGTHPERFITHYDVSELLEIAQHAPPLSKAMAFTGLRTVGLLARLPAVRGLIDRTPAAGILQLQHFHETLSLMGRSGAIYIAALNGLAMGGGLELALACDIRLMSGQAQLAQPEILLGFPPGGGGTQRLARLIGRGAALELMLEGRPVAAEEALRLGLVSRVLPPERLLDEAMATAQRLSRRSRDAVALTKQAVLEGGALSLAQGIEVEQAAFLTALGLPATQRAMQGYVAYLQRTGDVAAANAEAREQLLEGRFIDMTQP